MLPVTAVFGAVTLIGSRVAGKSLSGGGGPVGNFGAMIIVALPTAVPWLAAYGLLSLTSERNLRKTAQLYRDFRKYQEIAETNEQMKPKTEDDLKLK